MGSPFPRSLLSARKHRHREWVEALGDTRIAAVGRIEELHEIVGPDREKIDTLQQLVELIEQRRHLDHGADLDPFRELVAVPTQMRELALDQRLGLVEFLDRGDHGKHDLQLASAARPQQRADLTTQQAWPVEAKPDGAPAERRVLLLDVAHIGQHLVAADIEGAEGYRLVAGCIEHRAVQRELLGGARQGSPPP